MPKILLLIVILPILIAISLWLTNRKHQPGDKTYIEIRTMLRDKLLPLGFVESETAALGDIAKYARGSLLVEFYYDWREGEYSFFASREVKDSINPPRQVAITFFSADSEPEKKKSISSALEDWLEAVGHT